MAPTQRLPATVCLVLLAITILSSSLQAEPPDEAPKTGKAQGIDALVLEQEQIADKFTRLEETLLRMAELTAAGDPRRAALLKKAVAQSKERLIGLQLDALVELFRNDQLSKAEENQNGVQRDLRALLELLLSENRAKQLESEKARVRAYLRRLNEIINRQKDIQGRTAGSDEPQRLAGEQEKLAHHAGELAQDIQQNEEAQDGQSSNQPEPGQGGHTSREKPPSRKEPHQSGERKPGESKPDEDDKSDSDQKAQAEGKPPGERSSESDQPSQNQHGQGGDSSPSPQEQQQQQQEQRQRQQQQQQQRQQEQQDPAGKRIEAATQRMRQAREKLQQAQRDQAVEEQEEAIRQLQQAKAQLEEILRQLREEEIEQVLTMLEARFVKMLQMQREVYVGTQRLDEASKDGISHNQEIEAGRLAGREAEIVVEAEKALALLREEGSAVAFPEAVSQLSDDMRQLVQRLQKAEVGQITQAIEEDVIAALEEMIGALKQAIDDAQQRRQQQDSPSRPPGEPQDPSLVDLLAELRMIRALQMRINTRTERYSKLVTGQQADNAELLQALERLAERQERVFQITRDLEMGINR